MIYKEKKIFRKIFKVTEYAALMHFVFLSVRLIGISYFFDFRGNNTQM